MKKCTFCGKQFFDDALVCDADGQPLQLVAQPAPMDPAEHQRIIDEEHIRLLSIFHFVVAALALLGLGLVFLHYLLMSSIISNPAFMKTQANTPQMPKNFMQIFIVLYIIVGFILTCSCLGNVLSGLFLRKKKHRTFSIVIGGLNCLHIPFGTILGIFTIMVLSRNSVRKIYSD